MTGSNSVARLDSFPVLGGMQPQMALFRSLGIEGAERPGPQNRWPGANPGGLLPDHPKLLNLKHFNRELGFKLQVVHNTRLVDIRKPPRLSRTPFAQFG